MKSLPTHAPTNVAALDGRDPEAGNASHEYAIQHPNGMVYINFQHGPRVAETSTPGIYDDDLLAILQDRFEGYQAGKFSCTENQVVLDAIVAARGALADRVAQRMSKCILGVNKPH